MNDKEISEEYEEYDDPRKVFGSTLVELGRKNKKIVFVSCDSSLGAGGGAFNENFPSRHFEFGIQEQNAMGETAGMAMSGKIPYIAGYVPFIAFRCFEQIRDDICKTKLNVNIVGNNCGLSVSSLGPTHVVVEDVGVISSLPNITIISPCDGPEYSKAVVSASEIDGPVYLRIHRMKAKRLNPENYEFKVGKANILRKGSDVTIISYSTMVSRSLEASKILQEKGINAEVINMHTLKPIDEDTILESSCKTKKVVTVEEHSIVNGLGGAVASLLVRENPVKMKMFGIMDTFPVVGEYEELLEYYGLTGPKIAAGIEYFLANF